MIACLYDGKSHLKTLRRIIPSDYRETLYSSYVKHRTSNPHLAKGFQQAESRSSSDIGTCM